MAVWPYRVIDAFADRPFTGNPAAVALLPAWPDDGWLQKVAMEMNLSETAFLVSQQDHYELRWFTPKVEVDLCGHATLAAALALAEEGKLDDRQSVAFSTRSGTLSVRRDGAEVELDFPLVPAGQAVAPDALLSALGVRPLTVLKNRFDYLIELESARAVRELKPDFSLLSSVACRGVIVTALGDDTRYDFISRFFAPAVGIDEDPVTGSAHCSLAGYWGARLRKQSLVGYQASARGGVVGMKLNAERVILSGRGVVFARGEFSA